MKKILTLFLLVSGVVMFSGCAGSNSTMNKSDNENIANKTNIGKELINICNVEKVNLPNYGDPGKRLKNCFVEYPGEPTRQDKSYYILEDICGQFTEEFMENMLGQKIEKIEPPKFAGLNNCSYYLSDKGYLLLNLEYLPIENQKKGNEMAGRRVEKNPQIPKENLVVIQDDIISEIYFVLSAQKFLSINPNMKGIIKNEDFINLAIKFGEAIKDYK